MTVISLLKHPTKALPELLEFDSDPWLVPYFGYFFLALAEGLPGVSERHPTWSLVGVFLLGIAVSAILGALLWAGFYGGLLHVGSKLLGGTKGIRDTIRSVGYGTFWPGLVAVTAVSVFTAMTHTQNSPSVFILVPVGINILAAFWAVWSVMMALRVCHDLSWWRAVAAWLFPFVLVIPIALVWVALTTG